MYKLCYMWKPLKFAQNNLFFEEINVHFIKIEKTVAG